MSFDKINFNLANLGSLNNGFTSLDTTAMMQAMEPLFANSNINSNYMTAFDTFNINSMPRKMFGFKNAYEMELEY